MGINKGGSMNIGRLPSKQVKHVDIEKTPRLWRVVYLVINKTFRHENDLKLGL
jgi:hypothetical protein